MKWNILLCIVGFLFTKFGLISGQERVIGCNGYVKSAFPLEFEKIEIKLFTKQGSLKMKTDCAPNSGYYFIPLDDLKKGEYILKVSCPEGWTFDPDQYEINFDGINDNCSKEKDLNFDFKGFSVYGSVVTAGYKEGPSNIKVTLSGPHQLNLETLTENNGVFKFERIPPGKYVVKASSPDILFENDQHSFEIMNKNIQLEDKIQVSGYILTGHVFSDAQPVEGVYVVMYGESTSKIPTDCLKNLPDLNINKDSSVGKLLCLQVSNTQGQFQFKGVSPGKYNIVPVYRGKNVKTSYDVVPENMNVEVKHESLLLKTNFQVEGFTVQGKISKDLTGAKILVDGNMKAVSKNGVFQIPRMKPGKYIFEIQSDKFQFTPTKLEVSASNPILPEFSPSQFLVCGVIKGNDLSNIKQSLTLKIQSITGEAIREESILDTNNVCIFLPPGNYNAWISSLSNNKYFTPTKYNFQVPNNNDVAFQFSEFRGLIAGAVHCTLGCQHPVTVYLESNGKRIKEQSLTTATTTTSSSSSGAAAKKQLKFVFDNVESGTYQISIGQMDKYCWENQGIQQEIVLKDTNIDNLSIVQNGFRLKVTTSHDTKLNVLLKGQTIEKELVLKASQEETICLKNLDQYTLRPITCHIFEKEEYSIQPGVNTEIYLQAVKHLVSGKVISLEKIDDLQIKVNGQILEGDKNIVTNKNERGEYEYNIEFGQTPNTLVTVNFISVGFHFEPAEIEKQIGDQCLVDLFQVKARKAHIIKGKFVPALEGVQVRIDLLGESKLESTTVISNSKGEYIAGPFIHSHGFKVTPSLSGYTFKSMPQDEYSFTVYQLAKIQVKVEENIGQPLTNVLLSLSGPNAYRQNRYSRENGEMTFTDLQSGQYYLKALLKEFRFEPSAINIDLKEQETKKIEIKATRESFSLYGQLYALNGELMPNLLITAKGIDECKEYGEEGISDENGNFRIWALKSTCTYIISLGSGSEISSKVERTIPSDVKIKIEQQDIKNISFLVMTPVSRMDVSLRCHTNKDKYLDSLKVVVFSSRTPDIPIHRVSFNFPYLILPHFAKDESEISITFESSLNEFQYRYKLPNPINFIANESFAHFDFDFIVHPAPIEQDIGKSSYFAMFCVFLVIFASMYFDKISKFVKVYIENLASNSASSAFKKSKLKTK